MQIDNTQPINLIKKDNSLLIKSLEINPPTMINEMIKIVIKNRILNKTKKLDKVEDYLSAEKLEILKKSFED